MITAGFLLPCVPAVICVAFGYGIMSFSLTVCLVAVQDVSFYADALTEAVKVAILGTLQALVFSKLVKVCITEFFTVRVCNSLMVLYICHLDRMTKAISSVYA